MEATKAKEAEELRQFIRVHEFTWLPGSPFFAKGVANADSILTADEKMALSCIDTATSRSKEVEQ